MSACRDGAGALHLPACIMPFRRSFLLLCAFILAVLPATAQQPVDSALEPQLERIYANWKTAMLKRDLASWGKLTARSRQMMVRNLIVSQKREWPRSLFALAILPPELQNISLAGTQQLGDQARLVYHGRIDFGIDDPRTPPAAVMVVDFVREAAEWKFFGSRYYNFRDAPAEAAKVERGDLSFLSQPDMALTGRAPAVPKPCPAPDFSGQVRVASFGYTTHLTLGDHHHSTVSGKSNTEVVIGGLRRGINAMTLRVTPLADVKPEDRSLEVSVYAMTPHLRKPASRVFHFQPNNPVAENHSLNVVVGPSTMREGNESELLPGR